MAKNVGAFIITGAGKGLGRVLAKEAYAQGFPLALFARTKRDLLSLKTELGGEKNKTQKITLHNVDLTDEKAVRREFKIISGEHPSFRVLVNNAGTWTGGKKIEQLSQKEIQYSLDQNFFSALFATQGLLSVHRAKKTRSELSIVCIGATSSLQGWDHVGAFCLGKGALRIMAQSLAREVGPEGIHVAHLILDGLLDNERTRGLNPKLSTNRFMKQEEVAKSIVRVALQDRSCWTFEWDLRPYNEIW